MGWGSSWEVSRMSTMCPTSHNDRGAAGFAWSMNCDHYCRTIDCDGWNAKKNYPSHNGRGSKSCQVLTLLSLSLSLCVCVCVCVCAQSPSASTMYLCRLYQDQKIQRDVIRVWKALVHRGIAIEHNTTLCDWINAIYAQFAVMY